MVTAGTGDILEIIKINLYLASYNDPHVLLCVYVNRKCDLLKFLTLTYEDYSSYLGEIEYW